MRTFLALTPPPDSIIAIDEWRQLNWPLLERCVPPANFHITLAFIGDTTSEQIEALHDSLHEVRPDSFTITLNVLGFWEKTGIFWIGTDSISPKLSELAKQLNSQCQKNGVQIEKRDYVPHLTLARRCQQLPMPPMIDPNFSFAVTEFQLMKSISHNGRVNYEPIFTVPLTC